MAPYIDRAGSFRESIVTPWLTSVFLVGGANYRITDRGYPDAIEVGG